MKSFTKRVKANFRLLLILTFYFYSVLCWSQRNYLKFDNYRIDQGLSNNMVHCAFQDSKGWMWFGTSEGLNRFDGYKFVNFLPVNKDTSSIKGTLIRVIVEDKKGYLWVGCDNTGLNKYDRIKNRFTRYLKKDPIKALKLQNDSILWVATQNGLVKFNINTGRHKRYVNNPSNPSSLRSNIIRSVEIDKDGNVWVGTNIGLDFLDVSTDKISHIQFAANNHPEEVLHILCEDGGILWISTFSNGFYIFNTHTGKSENFIPDIKNERSYCVRKIIRDKDGIYWLGTRGGLYLFDKNTKQFEVFSYSDRDPNSICNNSVLDVSADNNGDIWVGTRGGVSYMAQNKQLFKHFKSFVNDSHYLNNPEIYAFWNDPNGNLWIGTESGGINIYNPKTRIYNYITTSNDILQSNTIKDFASDSKGNLWVATFLGGIYTIDIKSLRITRAFLHNDLNPKTIADNRVWALHFDAFGNLWVGTELGMDRYDLKTGTFEHYPEITQSQPATAISEDTEHNLWIATSKSVFKYNIVDKQVKEFNFPGRTLYVDSRGRYWFTSYYKGLILIDKNSGIKKQYLETDGLADNRTHVIMEDSLGNLWISTDNGLSRFNPDKETFTNFDANDGLQNNHFNYGAGIKLTSGEFVFGGVNGFNIFNPGKIKTKVSVAPLRFTDFRIFYKPVPVTNNKNAILKEDIAEASSVTIPYDKNVFMIEFALLDYVNTHKCEYAYVLEGFDKEWNFTGKQHSAIYTNLNPGKYTLHVKLNKPAEYGNKEISLKIRVLPPFWGTIWFKAILLLIVFFTSFLLVKFFNYRNQLKQKIVTERIKAKQIHELDLVKMKFFTNISHEIRTPLTLILGPIERMIGEKVPEAEMKSLLTLVHRNAQQLLRLVNQLLDFRKAESGNLKLELKKGDIVSFVDGLARAFDQLADEKEINLKVISVQKEINCFFDADKVEKVVNNLLSNAFKFTNKGGSVHVSISLVVENSDESNALNSQRYVEIAVKDTGIGISESNVQKIFHRFFQAGENTNYAGTGIGLSLTRELVKLHRGKINVESKPQKGTVFTILLPFIEEETESGDEINMQSDTELPNSAKSEQLEIDESQPEKILLIIEDNSDVRFFIRSHFEPEYKVVEAVDGREGLNAAFKEIPDVIISDIMMPVMDGLELCKKIKKDERTSHIPLILLTALTSRESIHDGLAAGADDFISKPFDILLLRTKVDNLLMLRRSLQMKYSGELLLQPKNITLSSPDEKFLKKAIETVEKYIDDPDLDTDKFAQYLGVSRMQLYRKIGALTDMTVKDFIRDLRLKRATQLLIQNKLNISEVAYAVGFKDLSHFRRCFRQEFGMTASEYVKKFGDSN